MESLYEILEVPQSATAEQIRSAYLKLAREYHPDRVPEHLTKIRADAEEKFKLVQQAWAVLGDPSKRSRYDRMERWGIETSTNATSPYEVRNPAQRTWNKSQAGRAVSEGKIADFWSRKQGVVKWSLLVFITTLVLVVVGEVIVARRSDSASARSQVSPRVAAPIMQSPRRIRTWEAPTPDLEVQLIEVISGSSGLELKFRVKAGEHANSLLYEPPGANGRTKKILGKEIMVDREMGELRIEDSSAASYVSTTGFIGGDQTNFNVYNFTRRIHFKPHQEVLLSAKFPAIAGRVSAVTFVSPALGKWQQEWRWPEINVK